MAWHRSARDAVVNGWHVVPSAGAGVVNGWRRRQAVRRAASKRRARRAGGVTPSVPVVWEGDDIPHELSEDCWCMPKVEVLAGGSVVTHNAINPRFWDA